MPHRTTATARRLTPARLTICLAAILLLGGCAGGKSATTGGTAAVPDSAAPTTAVVVTRPASFTHQTVTYTDASRDTEAGATTPGHPGRVLVTDLYVPDGPGPFPFIAFSHGLSGHPDKFTKLLSAWARAGYVVAAPAFPLTSDKVDHSEQNWRGVDGQPADVSFVITQVLAASNGSDGILAGKVDPERIGAAGLSLGGATTYALAFNDQHRDPRIKAVEVLSGALIATSGHFQLDGRVPMLISHGDMDGSLAYHLAADAYAEAASPVWFVTLLGAPHAPPYEDTVTPYDSTVETFTVDWWDATLGGGGHPGDFAPFERDAAVPGLTRLVSK